MKKIFITNTDTIDNGRAIEYFGVVSSHIVAGTGFLSDFAASVSDLFGGRSGSYQRQLESLYDEALDELSNKARLLGANSIFGLKIDMDNISGKGMSMFMITAVGTAAKVVFDKENDSPEATETITSAILVNEIAKQAILNEIEANNRTYFSPKYWETILRYPDKDYVIPLTQMYFKVMNGAGEFAETYKQNYDLFIQMADRQLAVDAIYAGMTTSSFVYARDLIKEYSLFDAKSILPLIKGGYVKQAVSILGAEQPSYTEKDLHDMEAVLDALNALPDVGRIEVVKGGVFSKDGEKYICQHGHKNNPDVEFCSDCGENIKGLGREHIGMIELFKNRVSILRELLMKQS